MWSPRNYQHVIALIPESLLECKPATTVETWLKSEWPSLHLSTPKDVARVEGLHLENKRSRVRNVLIPLLNCKSRQRMAGSLTQSSSYGEQNSGEHLALSVPLDYGV